MKPWAEMSVAERGGVLGGVAAVIAALFYGAWTVSRPEAPEAPAVAQDGAMDGAGDGAAPAEAAGAPEPEVDATAQSAEPAPASEAEEGTATPEPAVEAASADGAAETAEEGAAVPEAASAEAAPDTVSDEAAAPEAAPETGGEADAGTVAAADAALPEVQVAPPSLDLVRVERDGSALVAGSAVPASDLSLRVTGQEIVAVPADGQGNFVAMFNLAPSPAPRVLSLVMELPDGTEVPAEGSVVIAPTVAPVVASAAAGAAASAAAGAAAGEGVAEPEAPVAEAPAALLVTEEGARVLQSASDLPPELVANVTIDTITYTPEGAVQLAGRGTAERLVRLYLDNAPLAEAAISGAGDWAVTLPEVAPGLYTLRADQVDATGTVTSRFETPFQRETVEALAAAAAGAAPAEAGDGAAETAEVAADAPAPEAGSEVVAEGAVAASEEAAAEPVAATAPPAPVTVTVQPGFTLWQIATEQLGAGVRYVQVFEANRDQIRDPDLIYPGQVFAIPEAE